MTVSPPCIYCGETEPEKFSGREHVIPQAFGRFGSLTPVLKCVCDTCNAYFGRELDLIHARDTLEGVIRYKQGIRSSEDRPQRRLRFTLADDKEAGNLVGAAIGGVDPTSDLVRPIVAQLRLLNRQTGEVDIYTRQNLQTLVLAEEVYGPKDEIKPEVFAHSKEDYDAFVETLDTMGLALRLVAPTGQPINPTLDESGNPTLGVHIEAEFDQLHRRCLAKMAINFAAFYLSDSEARKPEWDFVKHAVRYGEGEIAARLSDKPFWNGQETENLRWPDAINIRLENHARGLMAAIQFYNRITYELLLIEGYRLEREPAARFVAGNEPEMGYRGRMVV